MKKIISLLCAAFMVQVLLAQAVFQHATSPSNTSAHITTLDHAQLNGNPNAVVFVSPTWEANGDQNPSKVFGVWYNGSRWTIFHQNRSEMLATADKRMRFTVLAYQSPVTNTFVHTANSLNISGHITTLDHPALNNKPNANIIVTQRYGVYNDHEIGVWYDAGRWKIFNQDRVALPQNAQFNVLIADNSIPGSISFQHTHTAAAQLPGANVGYTMLNNGQINGNPNWRLFATQRYVGAYNTNTYNIWYDRPDDDFKTYKNGSWFIYNSLNQQMPLNAAFNILAVRSGNNPPPVGELRGWVDMHTHPMSHLGFGRKAMHGAPGLGCIIPAGTLGCNTNEFRATSIDQALGNCNSTHGGWGIDNGCGDHIRAGIINYALDGNFEHKVSLDRNPHGDHEHAGYPGLSYWPNHSSILHQQMWSDWIRRARDGGLRVMVALTVNSELLAEIINGDGPYDDKTVADIQIDETIRFVNSNRDFMEIAYSKADLERIVRSNRIAVVLGMEVDKIGNFGKPGVWTTEKAVRAEIQRLYNKGIRYIFPIHLIDNSFGGSAVYNMLFNFANKRANGELFTVASSTDPNVQYRANLTDGPIGLENALILGTRGFLEGIGQLPAPCSNDLIKCPPPGKVVCCGSYEKILNILNPASELDAYKFIPGGHVNAKGLTPLGEAAINEMMKLGMMIDIDHMSERSMNRVIEIAESRAGGYPLTMGHNGIRGPGGDERGAPLAMVRRIAALGGMMGVGTAHGTHESFSKGFQDIWRAMGNRGVAIGSDANGFEPLPHRASGKGGAVASNYFYESFFAQSGISSKSKTGNREWDYVLDGGVSHYGIMPEFLHEVKINNGGEVIDNLNKSAAAFAQMWEKCERLKDVNNVSLTSEYEIITTFYTGGDDLRGGNDNVHLVVLLNDGTTVRFDNVNAGAKWGNFTNTTVRKALPLGIRNEDIVGVRLETTFTGGVGGDNWNLDKLSVKTKTGNTEQNVLEEGVERSLLFRFTGEQRGKDFFRLGNQNEIIATLYTGGDDLRGGNDNVHMIVLLRNGNSVRFNNVNENGKWANFTNATIRKALPANVRNEDIAGVRLETTFTGGVGGDNWNLDKLTVKTKIGGTEQGVLDEGRQGALLFRFTGDQRSKDFYRPGNYNEIIVTFYTGGDDLRGGNDNVHLVVLLNNGNSIRFDNVNERKGWANFTNTSIRKVLPDNVRNEDIKGVRVETTFAGGVGGDNWNLDKITVKTKIGGIERDVLEEGVERSLLFRFTGVQKTREFLRPNNRNELIVTLYTGGDDLRGGSDNVDVVVLMRDGSYSRFNNANERANWANFTNATVKIPLAANVRNVDIIGVRLETTSGGNLAGDNWNLDRITVKTKIGGVEQGVLDQGAERTLLFRFTGDQRKKEFYRLGNYNEIITTFYTGGDDLRGGNDNVHLVVLLQNGSSIRFDIVNERQGWANFTNTTIRKVLPDNVRNQDIKGVRVETTFGGGIGGDNWNLAKITVKTKIGGTEQLVLEEGVERSLLFRFTGDQKTKEFLRPSNRNEIIATFYTGGDDLRGGTDNVHLVILLRNNTTVRFNNVNESGKWANFTNATIRKELPATVRNEDIVAVQVETNFGGGIGGDNWNLDKIIVKTRIGGVEQGVLEEGVERTLLFRFTGDSKMREFYRPGAVTEIIATFYTGGDDLRGNNDNVHMVVLLRNGSSVRFDNVNERRGWGNFTNTTIKKALPSNVRNEDIRGIRLETTFGGGLGGDNWNLDKLTVKTKIGVTERPVLDQGVERSLLFRFTGSANSRDFLR